MARADAKRRSLCHFSVSFSDGLVLTWDEVARMVVLCGSELSGIPFTALSSPKSPVLLLGSSSDHLPCNCTPTISVIEFQAPSQRHYGING